ncbi:MAG: histidinol-phosphate transaminase [Acidimicrobiales bacterium]
MRPAVRPDLRRLSGYHSAHVDVEVRLNTNESPFGPPEALRTELTAAIARLDLNRYPDRDAHALRHELARHHDVAVEQVYCANGSNEVLQSLLLAYGGPGRTVAVFEPTYQLHAHIARVTGTDVAVGQRTDDHALDLAEVARVVADSEPVVTFLCSPNNPTGRAEPAEVVAAVAALAPGLLVVDEAYGQFARTTALERLRHERPEDAATVVVRTFSKTWSMAGVRLGYLVGPPEVVEACEAVTLPYHLDAVKQEAGRLALRYTAEMEARVALLVEERGRIAAGLGSLPVDTWPSDANFILFRPRERTASAVWHGLVERSVLVRDCSTWPGLSGCLRVTVGTPEENDRFLEALEACLR